MGKLIIDEDKIKDKQLLTKLRKLSENTNSKVIMLKDIREVTVSELFFFEKEERMQYIEEMSINIADDLFGDLDLNNFYFHSEISSMPKEEIENAKFNREVKDKTIHIFKSALEKAFVEILKLKFRTCKYDEE